MAASFGSGPPTSSSAGGPGPSPSPSGPGPSSGGAMGLMGGGYGGMPHHMQQHHPHHMQQPQQQPQRAGGVSADASWLVEVWADSLADEFKRLREAIVEYPYVAMDTEFPGVVARPLATFKTASDYHYQSIKCNCDLLKIIQLGITLFNERGERRPGVCTWQFNFKFELREDMYAEDSIQLLQNAGLDFDVHAARGIEMGAFGEAIMTSGLVLMDEVKWIVFHGAYDFGYLMKVLTSQPLPTAESEFFELLFTYFPNIYDLKYMMLSCETLGGSLQKLSEELGIRRIGTEHQAGSDSMVTGECFFAMRSRFFEDRVDDGKYNGVLYQLGESLDLQRRRRKSIMSGGPGA